MHFNNLFTMETLIGIAALIFSVSYTWSSWANGSIKSNKDLIDTLTKELIAQKELNKSYQDQINHLTEELGKMKGINEQTYQRLQEYTAIIANRDPKLEETLTFIKKVATDAEIFMKDMRKVNKVLLPKK